jgi:hypothetical protein
MKSIKMKKQDGSTIEVNERCLCYAGSLGWVEVKAKKAKSKTKKAE